MGDSTVNNKRIAKNTLLLYLRMFITLPLGLYTSRLVLEALGIESYGVYSAVGGMVALFSMLTGALSVSISRYLTYAIGKGDNERLNTIFSTSVNIQIFISLVIIIIAEVIGVWFLNTHMNIPSDRMEAANWVFQCSVITFIVSLVSVPYNALIIAHERMSAFAYMGVVESVLKFLIALGLCYYKYDRLILYALLLMSVSIAMRIIYGVYCSRYFVESKYHFIVDKSLIKEMSKFIGWAFWGNGVVVLKEQGTSILLNIFGGPVINAAQGVAMQINGVVSMFVNNFLMAVHPQITKSFAANEFYDMHHLIIRASKLSFFILWILFVPICMNIDYLLKLWLVEVPPYTSHFVVLILLASMMQCFNQPLLTGVLAEGKIKRYEIFITVIYMFNFLANLFLLKMGLKPYCVYVINVLILILILAVLLREAKQKYHFPIIRFCKESLMRVLLTVMLCVILITLLQLEACNSFPCLAIRSVVELLMTFTVIFIFGMNKQERSFIYNLIKAKINK